MCKEWNQYHHLTVRQDILFDSLGWNKFYSREPPQKIRNAIHGRFKKGG